MIYNYLSIIFGLIMLRKFLEVQLRFQQENTLNINSKSIFPKISNVQDLRFSHKVWLSEKNWIELCHSISLLKANFLKAHIKLLQQSSSNLTAQTESLCSFTQNNLKQMNEHSYKEGIQDLGMSGSSVILSPALQGSRGSNYYWQSSERRASEANILVIV